MFFRKLYQKVKRLDKEIAELGRYHRQVSRMVRCGVGGHTFSLKRSWGDSFKFECMGCEAEYFRDADKLTEKEKAMVVGTLGEDVLEEKN